MNNKRDVAFTLLELLIALSLFAVVMIVVGSVFGTGLLVWKRGEGESGFYQELRVLFDRLAVELRNTLPYEGTPFEGKKDRMSFVQVRSSRASPSPEWVQVTYEVKKGAEGILWVRRMSPFSKKEEEEEQIVLSAVTDVQFSYPSFTEGEEGWTWAEEWRPPDQNKGSPPFIRASLLLAGGEKWEKLFMIPTGIGTEEESPSPEPEGEKGEEG